MKILVASSNPGKVREYEALAAAFGVAGRIELALLPGLSSLVPYPEKASTFAENAAGKALHYSRFADDVVLADDSGLCVDALGGAPGVQSARYAGAGASDGERVNKLLRELSARKANRSDERGAHFVCVLALAQKGRAQAVVSARADGQIVTEPRGAGGFGYDPVFFYPPLAKTFAELTREEKNQHSHRGKAFRRVLEILEA